MEFKTNPILYCYGIIGNVIFILALPLWCIIIISKEVRESIFLTIEMVFLILLNACVLLGMFRIRKLFFAKAYIDQNGIVEKCYATANHVLLWDSVADCGIMKSTASNVDQIWCIYFSETKLSLQQKSGKVAYSKDKVLQQAVRIPLCVDAIEALERFAPEIVVQMLKTDPQFPSEWFSKSG